MKNNYDVILLDIGLFHYTGFDFLMDFKIEKPSEIRKVIIVTLLQLEIQTQFLMNLVFIQYNKPISVQHVISKMMPKLAS